MKKTQWIVCRNGEYIKRCKSLQEAQDELQKERERLEKHCAQGWFEGPVSKAFRLDIVQR
jgi:hypothetical protein